MPTSMRAARRISGIESGVVFQFHHLLREFSALKTS